MQSLPILFRLENKMHFTFGKTLWEQTTNISIKCQYPSASILCPNNINLFTFLNSNSSGVFSGPIFLPSKLVGSLWRCTLLYKGRTGTRTRDHRSDLCCSNHLSYTDCYTTTVSHPPTPHKTARVSHLRRNEKNAVWPATVFSLVRSHRLFLAVRLFCWSPII